VSSLDPSSTTMISRQWAAFASDETTRAIEALSFTAGITMEVSSVMGASVTANLKS
jgi:hypothetical protein